MSGSTHHIYLPAAQVAILDKLREERGQSISEILRAGLDELAEMHPAARLAGFERELRETDARRKVLKAEIRKLNSKHIAETIATVGNPAPVPGDNASVLPQVRGHKTTEEEFERLIGYAKDPALIMEPEGVARLTRRILTTGSEHQEWVDSLPLELKTFFSGLTGGSAGVGGA